MLVQLYSVFVPYSGSSKQYLVPKYDLPIIDALWRRELQPGQTIEVVPTGVVGFRRIQDEEKRIRREYASSTKGSSEPAWRHAYPRDLDFIDAWERESKLGHELHLENERATAQAKIDQYAREAEAKAKNADDEATDAVDANRKPGRTRKSD